MTELDTVDIQQHVPSWSGVQQPTTMFYNKGLYLLICITLPARLTGCYSSLISWPFGHGKRSLSPLSRTSRSLCRDLDPDVVFGVNPDNLSINLERSQIY
jgi:hypothetical protein